jgi:hypothetical protein
LGITVRIRFLELLRTAAVVFVQASYAREKPDTLQETAFQHFFTRLSVRLVTEDFAL